MLKLLQIKRRDLNQIRRCFAFVWKRLFEPVERHDRIRGEVRRRCSKVRKTFQLSVFIFTVILELKLKN